MKRLDQFVILLLRFFIGTISPFLVFKIASVIGLSLGYVTIAVALNSSEASSYTTQTVASLPNKLCFTDGSKRNPGLRGSKPSFPPSFMYEVTVIHSAFQTIPHHQIPLPRRITQDEAPSMMPMPQNTSHQAAQPVLMPFAQSHSKPGSSASFASLSGGGHYAASGGNPARKKVRLV